MDFFLHKPTSIFDLFQTTFQIFCRGWKTILSVYFLVNFLAYFLVAFLAFISDFGLGLIMTLSQVKVVFHFVYCFWLSIFDGAISEIVATIYIGGDPCYKRSFKKGWHKKWPLFEFRLVVRPGVNFVINKIQEKIALHNFVVVALKTILTIAAPGAIAIENMSPTKALERSMKLCGKNFMLTLATMLYYNVLVSPKEGSENHDTDMSSIKVLFNYVFKSIIFWRIFLNVLYITMRAEEKDFDIVQFEKEVNGTK